MGPRPLNDEQVKKQTSKPAIKATSKLNPQTGVLLKAASKFSTENWGPAMRHYVKSINKMKVGSLESIMDLATSYMSPLKSHWQLSSHNPHVPTDNCDVCACLVEN
jgi:hypothetical protein